MSMGYVYILDAFFEYSKGVSCFVYISAWASALLVQTGLGNAKAL